MATGIGEYMDGVTRAAMSSEPPVRREPIGRRRGITPPSVILVGASTGGPQALTLLVAGLVPVVSRLPICVTLHMPADLMSVVASHVERTCGVQTQVVQARQALLPGIVYFAPGDRHLDFHRRSMNAVDIQLRPGPSCESCKPAVDVMFKSGAACFGPRVLAIVLSGMGEDGLAGAGAIVAAGGSILVQDKASSAVWGMPGAIAKADLATAILAPSAIASEIVRRFPLPARSA